MGGRRGKVQVYRITLNVEEDVYRALKVNAAQRLVSVSVLVSAWVRATRPKGGKVRSARGREPRIPKPRRAKGKADVKAAQLIAEGVPIRQAAREAGISQWRARQIAAAKAE